MSDNQKNPSEGTDLNEVFQKAKEQIQNGQNASTVEKTKFKLNDKQKAVAILGTVLLGGTAFVAVEQVNGQVVEPQVTPIDSTQVHTADSVSIDSSAVTQQIAVGETQTVTGGTICPNEDIQIASGVTDSMSFSEAFAVAREEVGPGGVFNWNGTTYNTFFKEEWNQIGLADKQEFLHSMGYRVEVPDPRNDDSKPDQPVTPEPLIDWASADIKEAVIDGKLTYFLDVDKDGIADAIVMYDEDNGAVVLLDDSGDGSLDTLVLMDANMQPIESQTLDDPREVLMVEADEYNGSNENENIVSDEMEAEAFEAEVEGELEEDGVEDSDEGIGMSGDYSNDDDVDDLA